MIDLGTRARKRGGKSARGTAPAGLAMHSAASSDWGTPMLLRRFAASVLRPSAKMGGAIDLDYATSAYWQSWWPGGDSPRAYLDGSFGRDVLVDADREAACPRRGSGFLNAPGLNGGAMVQKCWELFERDHREEKLGSGVWIGFSLEHFASFQGLGRRNPLTARADDLIMTIVPSRRSRYLLHPEQLIAILRKKQATHAKRSKQWLAEQRKVEQLRNRVDDAPVPGNAPSHASYITLLLSMNKVIRRRQYLAVQTFLKASKKDPKSLLHRVEIIGSLAE